METKEAFGRGTNVYLYETLTEEIIGAAIEVHSKLGPGLYERPYKESFVHELTIRGIPCRSEVQLPIQYKGLVIENAYKIDVLVNELVVVEMKAVEKLLPIHHAQIMTYLKLSGLKVGLLFNFGATKLKDEMKRFAI